MKNEKQIFEWRGVSDLVAAEVLTDNETGYTTGEVFPIAGVAEIGKTTESNSEAHYYDNTPAVSINSTGADEITCNISALPLDVLAKLTGQIYDEALGALFEGERSQKYYALGYKTKKTNGNYVYVWRLKGTFSIPEETHVTEDDGTDANGQELVYTGISTIHKFTKNNRSERAVTVDLEKDLADVSTFFDAVTDPDKLKKKGE